MASQLRWTSKSVEWLESLVSFFDTRFVWCATYYAGHSNTFRAVATTAHCVIVGYTSAISFPRLPFYHETGYYWTLMFGGLVGVYCHILQTVGDVRRSLAGQNQWLLADYVIKSQ